MHSFHLSQPFSQSYRSILPTSLIYVMLFRHQRLLTLRTWCGYRYEMVWKWLQQHIIFHGTIGIHSYWKIYRNFWRPHISSQDDQKINHLFKQIITTSLNKLNSVVIDTTKLPWQKCFYTEKKTLNWIPIAVIMFIYVTITYPDKSKVAPTFSPCTGILTCFLFDQ